MTRFPVSLRPTTVLVLLALGSASSLLAQVEIDRRRAAPPHGEIALENDFGTLLVRGWDRAEIQVRGTLAAGAEDLDFDADQEGARVAVEVPDAWIHASGEDPSFRSTIEVMVPAAAQLSIRTVNASIDVQGVAGRVEVDTVNGLVRVAGRPREVDLETMTGAVELHGHATSAEIETISGNVIADGLAGEVRVETVSGSVTLTGTALSDLRVKTTTGAVDLAAAVARKGEMEIETFSSPVHLRLPRTTQAVFELQSFAGEITSDFCAGTPLTREPFEPFRKLHCSTGSREFEIQVQTHDADITISAHGDEKGGSR